MYTCKCGCLTLFGFIEGKAPVKKPKKKKTKEEQNALNYIPLCFACWVEGGKKEALDHMPHDESHPSFASLSPEVKALEDPKAENKPESAEKKAAVRQ